MTFSRRKKLGARPCQRWFCVSQRLRRCHGSSADDANSSDMSQSCAQYMLWPGSGDGIVLSGWVILVCFFDCIYADGTACWYIIVWINIVLEQWAMMSRTTAVSKLLHWNMDFRSESELTPYWLGCDTGPDMLYVRKSIFQNVYLVAKVLTTSDDIQPQL